MWEVIQSSIGGIYWEAFRPLGMGIEWGLGVLAPSLLSLVLSGYDVSSFALFHTPMTWSFITSPTATTLTHQRLEPSKL